MIEFNLWKDKLNQGNIEIGAFDRDGEALHQYDIVTYEGEHLLIMWSPLSNEYTAQSTEGHWISFENLHLTKRIGNLVENTQRRSFYEVLFDLDCDDGCVLTGNGIEFWARDEEEARQFFEEYCRATGQTGRIRSVLRSQDLWAEG